MTAHHPDAETLAELDEGLLDDPTALRLRAHVDNCPTCTDILADLAGVRELLRDLPPVPMPDDVARRLETVLATEHASATGAHGGTVLPASGRSGRPRRTLLAGSAAAGVIGLLVVGLALGGIFSSGSGSNGRSGGGQLASGRAPGSSGPVMTATDTAYTKANLAGVVSRLLASTPTPLAAGAMPSPWADGFGAMYSLTTSGGTGPDADPYAGAAPVPQSAPKAVTSSATKAEQRLSDCAYSLMAGAKPIAVDLGSYEGIPAALIAFADPDNAAEADVFVVKATDACPGGFFSYYAVVPRSGG